MHSRKLWLATTAVAALATAQQAQADGMYVSVFGGANFQKDDSNSFGSFPTFFRDHNTDPDTGFVIGGAIGAGLDNWVKGMRVELEASYRRNDVGGNWRSGFTSGYSTFSTGGSIDANASTFAIMANVAYDIDMGWKVTPYVMGGAGWARSRFEGADYFTGGGTFVSYEAENSGFAWQLGAGFNYEVAPGVDVGLGYRYFDGPDSSYFAGKFLPVDRDNTNHAVTVNLTIETN